MQFLKYKPNYDSQINKASPMTFIMFTVGTDFYNWVKSVKNYVVKGCAKQLGGSEVTRAQSGLN
jgi:hypothetical protein